MREFRPMAIPEDKKFKIILKSLPHTEGQDEPIRGVQNEGTGMDMDEEHVCLLLVIDMSPCYLFHNDFYLF